MSTSDDIDFGPLTELIGLWQGQDGIDIAPEPDGKETNPYHETIEFSEVGGVTNAESQDLAVLHYRQIVSRKSDNKVFHDQSGYWIWEASTNTVMHSFSIPRAVCVLAGGTYDGETDAEGRTVLNVKASVDEKNWSIVQSPFMDKNARTESYAHTVTVGNETLSYAQTTMVDIYGKMFEHTDQNALVRSA